MQRACPSLYNRVEQMVTFATRAEKGGEESCDVGWTGDQISVCLARHGARNGRGGTDVSFSSPFGDGRWGKLKEQHSEQQTGRRTHSEQGKGGKRTMLGFVKLSRT